jgi:putative AlgH/UPF0301 family transcriptional regulator
MNNKFLTDKQQQELTEKKWIVVPQGRYLTLYKEDFGNNNAWQEICQQLDVDTRSEQVDVLFFGVQSDY